jgi:hypothetical protein
MGMRRQSAAKVLKLVGKNGDGSMMGAYPDGARASSIQQRRLPRAGTHPRFTDFCGNPALIPPFQSPARWGYQPWWYSLMFPSQMLMYARLKVRQTDFG